MVRKKLTIDRESFGLRLNIDLVKKLKIVAVNEGSAVNVLMEEAIQDLLKKYKSN